MSNSSLPLLSSNLVNETVSALNTALDKIHTLYLDTMMGSGGLLDDTSDTPHIVNPQISIIIECLIYLGAIVHRIENLNISNNESSPQ